MWVSLNVILSVCVYVNACGHICIYCIHVKSLFFLHVGDVLLVIAFFHSVKV